MPGVFTTDVYENITEVMCENITSTDCSLYKVESTIPSETALPTGDASNASLWIYDIGYAIVPLLLVAGLFGNTCVLIIMGTIHFRTTTTAVNLIALALSDTQYILLFPFTKSFTQELFGLDPRAISIAGCKAFFCLFRSAKIISSGIVILISIERFIVVWFPLRAKRLLTRKAAIFLVLILVSMVYIFDGLWTVTTSIMDGVCIPNFPTEETKDISTAFIVAGIIVYNVVPSSFLAILSLLTILKLFRHRSNRIKMTSSATNRSDDTFHITRMLLAVMIAYLILVTPTSVAHSVAFFTGDNIFESTNINFIIFREVAQIFEQLNYVVNFFIYLTFNSSFRRHFCNLICRRKIPAPQVVSHPNLDNPRSEDPRSSSLEY